MNNQNYLNKLKFRDNLYYNMNNNLHNPENLKPHEWYRKYMPFLDNSVFETIQKYYENPENNKTELNKDESILK